MVISPNPYNPYKIPIIFLSIPILYPISILLKPREVCGNSERKRCRTAVTPWTWRSTPGGRKLRVEPTTIGIGRD